METIPRISHVLPEPGYRLRLAFQNGEVRTANIEKFMVTPWLNELRDPEYFRQVRVIEGGWGVEWPNEQDFSRDTLYLNSRRVRFGVRSSSAENQGISTSKSNLKAQEAKATSRKSE